jgi:RNA polymerase sigma-70 factor (ECF subfamily)
LDVEDTKPPEPADGTLVLAAVLGNLEAFAELVRRYRRAAVRIAAGIAGPEAAEDIAQDACLLAFKALPDLDEPDRFAAWLSAITRNRALRWIRRESRMVRVGFDDALLTVFEKAEVGQARERDAAAALVEGLDQLPESCRLVMRLRWLDEMSMQQIAAFTGLPVSTVKWRLHEGKRLLREWNEAAVPGARNADPHGVTESRPQASGK